MPQNPSLRLLREDVSLTRRSLDATWHAFGARIGRRAPEEAHAGQKPKRRGVSWVGAALGIAFLLPRLMKRR
jgi:hypothetical protein